MFNKKLTKNIEKIMSAPPRYSEKGAPEMTLIEWLRTMDCGVYAKKFSGTLCAATNPFSKHKIASKDFANSLRGALASRIAANGINSIAEAMTLTDDRLKSMDVVRLTPRFFLYTRNSFTTAYSFKVFFFVSITV